jgi:hypothetical protein
MKKQNKQSESLKKVTVIFGYSLFGLLLLAVVLSTVLPFGSMLLTPGARHFNMWVSLVSLTAGAILPPLVSYLIGDKATHSKSKLDRHFNGVLFGVASYWLSLFFFFIGSDVIGGIRSDFTEPLATAIAGWPILATLIVLSAVAVGYVRNQKRQPSLLEYKPYQFTLFAGLIASFVYILSNQYFVANTLWVISLLYVVIPVILIGVTYKLLSAKYYSSVIVNVTLAVVVVSVGFIASSIAGQLLMHPDPSVNTMVSVFIGVLVLALYIALIRRLK